ncbi:MAG: serine dehydratase subunit alpha family protein, partial [Oscillospiraceae bacterium]
MLTKEALLGLLTREVVPALGCTEPVCVALAAADASCAIGGQIVSIKVSVNANILKNGMSVGIPGCPNVGLNYAAALGACMANPQKGLELLADITDNVNTFVSQMIADDRVKIAVDPNEDDLYVRAEVITTSGLGISVIRESHANIVYTKANDKVLVEKKVPLGEKRADDVYETLKTTTLAQLRQLVEQLSDGELLPMLDGMRMNGLLADYGLSHDAGVGIGRTLEKLTENGVFGQSLNSRIMA